MDWGARIHRRGGGGEEEEEEGKEVDHGVGVVSGMITCRRCGVHAGGRSTMTGRHPPPRARK
jgi:hypothetical protein